MDLEIAETNNISHDVVEVLFQLVTSREGRCENRLVIESFKWPREKCRINYFSGIT